MFLLVDLSKISKRHTKKYLNESLGSFLIIQKQSRVMAWRQHFFAFALGFLALWPVVLWIFSHSSCTFFRLKEQKDVNDQKSVEDFKRSKSQDAPEKKLNPKSDATGSVFTGRAFRQLPPQESAWPCGDRLVCKEALDHAAFDIMNSTNCRSSQWAVMTTIQGPTAAVADLASRKDWCVVVVGDLSGPREFRLADSTKAFVIFLDSEFQSQLAASSSFVNTLPWRSFGRKNVGYLYAIFHGASVIWDFDDDNQIIVSNFPPSMDPTSPSFDVLWAQEAGATSGNLSVLNVYHGLGCTVWPCWPRGFPLSLVKSGSPKRNSWKRMNFRVGMLQSLADIDPDVDAIFRLTSTMPTGVHFKPSQTASLGLPPFVFCPANAQAALHHRDAFWALLLPTSVSGRVADIWRSYFAQRLFWDIGINFVFSPPLVKQERNIHNLMADYEAEKPLYSQTEALLNFLWTWKSDLPTLPERIQALWNQAYTRGYIEKGDLTLLQQWLFALQRAGYKFPPIQPARAQQKAHVSGPPAIGTQFVPRVLLLLHCDAAIAAIKAGDQRVPQPVDAEIAFLRHWLKSGQVHFACVDKSGANVTELTLTLAGLIGISDLDAALSNKSATFSHVVLHEWDLCRWVGSASPATLKTLVMAAARGIKIAGYFEGMQEGCEKGLSSEGRHFVKIMHSVTFLSTQPCKIFATLFPEVSVTSVLQEGWAFEDCQRSKVIPVKGHICFFGTYRKPGDAETFCSIAENLPEFSFTTFTAAGKRPDRGHVMETAKKCRAKNIRWISHQQKQKLTEKGLSDVMASCAVVLDFSWSVNATRSRPTTKVVHALSCGQAPVVQLPSDFEMYGQLYGAIVPHNATVSEWAEAIRKAQDIHSRHGHWLRKTFEARINWPRIAENYFSLLEKASEKSKEMSECLLYPGSSLPEVGK